METEDLKVYTIQYHYGSYTGEVRMVASEAHKAILKMWANFERQGLLHLSMAAQSARVINVEPYIIRDE